MAPRIKPWILFVAFAASSFLILLANDQLRAASPTELPALKKALYSGPIGGMRLGRSAITKSQLQYQYVMGGLKPPQEGDFAGQGFRGTDQHWKQVEVGEDGVVQSDRMWGGVLYLAYEADEPQTAIFRPNGFSEVFVNGVPRTGDGYGNNRGILPIQLQAGLNEIWCKPSRGREKSVAISTPPKPIYLTNVDPTVPDFLTTESEIKWAAVRVVNATDQTHEGLVLRAKVADHTIDTPIAGAVTHLTTRKLPFQLQDPPSDSPGEQVVHVSLLQGDQILDELDLKLEVKAPTKQYRRTFVSDIDGSVQYYAVREGTASAGKKPAMFLSVHGAGVKAIGQAGSYQSKDWGHIVAPTNRREFGFDWEDWGRLDAMEALDDAETRYGTDPQRTYLTGHSMGGHGTWYLGATYPSRWAAIAPMAGWRSFFSYARRSQPKAEPSPMQAMFQRAANPSRTLEMTHNYTHMGVYIEHGDNDQSVPVREARFMRDHLAEFHPDFAYHEEQGGAHWYGVDHAYVFDYFRWHQVKDVRDLETLEFRIACPGISARSHYITLYQQEEPYQYCGIVSKQTIRSRSQRRHDEDIDERKFDIKTENLRQFKIDLAHCQGFKQISLEIDDQPIDNLPWPQQNQLWLKKQNSVWQLVDAPNDPAEKNPQRYGGFKDAFRHRVVFVYATQGDDEANAWSYNKARFDAETFYFRGNGSIEIIPDKQFSLEAYPDRSVILYGNASTNAAWQLLLDDCPVQVRRGELHVGNRILSGDHLGLYMVRPRKDSAVASVGVIAGTGKIGNRAITPNRYFLAGTGFPDLMIVTPKLYSAGIEGVKAAGYFGNDWSLDGGTVIWSDATDHSEPATGG